VTAPAKINFEVTKSWTGNTTTNKSVPTKTIKTTTNTLRKYKSLNSFLCVRVILGTRHVRWEKLSHWNDVCKTVLDYTKRSQVERQPVADSGVDKGEAEGLAPPPAILQTKHKHTFKLH